MTEKNLSLKEIAIENDVYLAYWIRSLKPIYNQYYTYGRFMEVNQKFYENILEMAPSEDERASLLRDNRTFLVLTRRYPWMVTLSSLLSPLLSFKDSILGFISKKYITRKIPSSKSEGILVNDDIVKLHFNDRRREIRDQILDSNE